MSDLKNKCESFQDLAKKHGQYSEVQIVPIQPDWKSIAHELAEALKEIALSLPINYWSY